MTGSPADTRYARSGEVHIAYQVVGNGPFDLVFSPSPVSNMEVAWEWPPFARFLRRLASFSRLILFDKRGTGLSDRVTDAATLEERMDDVRAVMDAAGSERAALFGSSEGGPMALLFAATYPDRVTSLVLYGSYAKAINSADYSSGVDLDIFELGLGLMEQEWGSCALIDVFSPSVRDDTEFRSWWGRYERQSASPGAAVAIQRLNARLDVRPILPAITTPTLIIYRAGEFVAHVEGSKYLAQHIAGASYVELPGVDYHPYVGDQDAILDPIEEFLTGRPPVVVRDTALLNVVVVGPVPSERMQVLTALAAEHSGEVVGDGGVTPVTLFVGPGRAVSFGLAVRDIGPDAHVGVHIGEVDRGRGSASGLAIDIARSVHARAKPGEVLVSRTVADLLPGSDVVLSDAGVHTLHTAGRAWQLFSARRPGERGAEATVTWTGVFRRDGDVWMVGLGDALLRVRDVKGLADIATLLARPGVDIHVAELVDSGIGADASADATLDRTAIAGYRERLADLIEEETEADQSGDIERASRAREERQQITAQLSADLGLGGRARVQGNSAERARKTVRTRVAHALKRIESAHPTLGRHLRASIRTGVFCAYEPSEPVHWEL
jgi:pimeloyl-ACP methyl ester carboxylesterase